MTNRALPQRGQSELPLAPSLDAVLLAAGRECCAPSVRGAGVQRVQRVQLFLSPSRMAREGKGVRNGCTLCTPSCEGAGRGPDAGCNGCNSLARHGSSRSAASAMPPHPRLPRRVRSTTCMG